MKILLAIDGSAFSLEVARHALRNAKQGLRASLVLVNVQEPASLYEIVVAHDAEVIRQVRSAAGADLLAPAEALLDAAGVAFESEVAGGAPAATLLELTENYGCSAIIAGARGLGAASIEGLGSVVHALLLHSPVPVTVVRLPAAATEGEGAA